MKVLISGANGRTGQAIIAALRERPDTPTTRGVDFNRCDSADESVEGDINDPTVLEWAVDGVDAIVHYGARLSPRETAIGTGMIDAAEKAGVKRFVFISVIHAEIEDLLNHRAKLAIESYLINSRLDWSIVRPQHYMQNIDVALAVAEGKVEMPYPVETALTHVDMSDLAEAAAIVLMEPGHAFATYDISGDEHLSVKDICSIIARSANKPVEPMQIGAEEMVERQRKKEGDLPGYTVDGMHRLYGYYSRHGIKGNAHVLTWLLGRRPTSFGSFVAAALRAPQSPQLKRVGSRDNAAASSQ